MGDIAVENYKTSVKKITANWKTKVDAPAKALVDIEGKLQKLEAIKSPTQADKDQMAKLEAEYLKNRKLIEKANLELKLDLSLITPIVKTKANAVEVDKLPDFIKTIIKEKGVPIGKGVTIAPAMVEFDFKAMKLKSLGFKITWKF